MFLDELCHMSQSIKSSSLSERSNGELCVDLFPQSKMYRKALIICYGIIIISYNFMFAPHLNASLILSNEY